MVTSYQVSGSGDAGGPPTVVVDNNSEEIKVTQTEYGEDGTELGNVEAEFDDTATAAKVLEASSKKKTKKKKKSKKK